MQEARRGFCPSAGVSALPPWVGVSPGASPALLPRCRMPRAPRSAPARLEEEEEEEETRRFHSCWLQRLRQKTEKGGGE